MLVLTRKMNECIAIGPDIVIKVTKIEGNQVRLGITAPSGMEILRTEIMQPSKPEIVRLLALHGRKLYPDHTLARIEVDLETMTATGARLLLDDILSDMHQKGLKP